MAAPPAAKDASRATEAVEAKPLLPDLAKTQITLPWNELATLLGRGGREDRNLPPVDHVFAQVEYTAGVAGDRASIVATAEVSTLGKAWTLVPLGPPTLGVVAVKADGQPCPLVQRDGTLWALLSGPNKHKLELLTQPKVVESAQGRQFELTLIGAPLVTLKATLPGAGLEVQAEGALVSQTVSKDQATVLTATCRGGTSLTVAWKARPAVPRPTRLYADTETLATVEDGLVRVHSLVNVQLLHTPTRELRFRLDGKAVLLGVTGKNVVRWNEQPAADKSGDKLAAVLLAQPILGDQTLEIVEELELPAEGGKLALAAPRVEQSHREQGYLAVSSTDVMSVEPGEATARRIGVSQLPERLRSGGGPLLAYHYTRSPAAVGLVVSRPKPQPAKRFATTNTLVSLQPGRLVCRALVHYEVLHAGIDRLRITLPEDTELLSVEGDCVRGHSLLTEEKSRVLVIDTKDLVKGECAVTVAYARRFKESDKAVSVGLVAHPDAEIDRGSVGIEVRSNYEVAPAAEGFERIDVKELPSTLWNAAGSPVLFAYRYAAPQPAMSLGLTRHEDLSVLVAMSDFCEAATVITPDGKPVTKMMFIVRNNLKPFLALKLPEGAEMWSALVDDRPVTPARNGKGDVLIPLKKSEEVDEDDEESYRARREKRRKEGPEGQMVQADRVHKLKERPESMAEPKDLKPYDVEIVFVGKKVDLAERGQVKLLLPQSDVPVGHLAWAVFLPKSLHVTDSAGNLQEVSNFTLPFRHFGVVECLKRRAQELKQAQEAMKAMEQAAQQLDKAAAAKAQGVLPVRIEIPITGEIYKFEKFLVVDDTPELSVSYRRKTE
jgi:hypothetical protein